MKEGWICPRCSKVNAPFIGQCTCNILTIIIIQMDCVTMCGVYNLLFQTQRGDIVTNAVNAVKQSIL